jgi:hypothetical protein
MKNKGSTNTILLETIAFVIFNLAFFFILLIFVYNSGSQTFVYEQSYAKQIALLIDNAKTDMIIMVNVVEINKIALEKNKPLDKIFYLDKGNNKVSVSLNPSGGYSYSYFSDYNVDLKLNGDWLSIIITRVN